MFYFLSKSVGFLLQPSVIVLMALGLGLLAGAFGRARAARRLLLAAFFGLLIGGLSPLAHILTIPLENRFPRPKLEQVREKAAGIIMLGGAQDTLVATKRKVNALTDAAERLTDSLMLMKALPGKPLVISGGGAQILYDSSSEAETAHRMFERLGADPKLLWREERSRNTYQNAAFTRRLLEKRGMADKPWLLVTTAFHMPRAMGCFRKAGLKVIPWPVDYRTRGWSDAARPFSRPSNGLRRLDMIMREYIGLLAYRLTGRTNTLLPGP